MLEVGALPVVDADAADRSLASSMAKAYVSDAYRKVAGDGIQVHGGGKSEASYKDITIEEL